MAHPDQAQRDQLLDTWAALLEAHARLQRLLASELSTSSGLSLSTAEVLLRLLERPEHSIPTTELARAISFTSGGFTKFVDRLAAAGLVERRPSPHDRRVVHVALTDEGLTAARTAADALVAGLRRHALEPLGPQSFATLKTLLEQVGGDVTQEAPAQRQASR